MPPLSQILALGAGIGLAYFGPILTQLAVHRLQELNLARTPEPHPSDPAASASGVEWTCGPDNYTTELISLDPLVVYIHNLVSPREADLIIKAGEPLLEPSPVTGYGAAGGTRAQSRTSWSAPLPGDDAAVACVLARARRFLGTLLAPRRDEMGVAQMVRYTAGQKFDLHHDWFRQPRLLDGDGARGRRRLYNRVATFFVVLQDGCSEGETYFPQIRPIAPQDWGKEAGDIGGGGAAAEGDDGVSGGKKQQAVWRMHEQGGMAFRPVRGNALFWVNLMANGSGDPRVLHAGLPVGDGMKTAMNIWPRTFFGPDA
ncbi:uncharacterized protein E0L32_004047 [Thyridium curvatum]|uniref:Prolyl 4-hydroxylase alpha subunit domain-containing protein n=1 Tax=Thyridium curvatum TaxID=1093900 RepID=A0A507BIA4_9PEZI|nr:uncharacterized protein E0L32_004047 [Thyridium curvatum]TPX16398.1 hypothetical protein E0L32_004047 [Thyridium curvatum]